MAKVAVDEASELLQHTLYGSLLISRQLNNRQGVDNYDTDRYKSTMTLNLFIEWKPSVSKQLENKKPHL